MNHSGFVHLYGIAAPGALHPVAFTLVAVQCSALRTHIKQSVKFVGHTEFGREFHLGLPVPDIVVVSKETVHCVLYFNFRQRLQLVRSKHLVHNDFNAAITLVDIMLGEAQVAS